MRKILLWGLGLATGFYTTFVLQNLWNWFAVPALHTSEVSYFAMFGLMLIAGLLTETNEFEEGQKLEILVSVLELCVPEHKLIEKEARMEEMADAANIKLAFVIGSKLIGRTIALAIGWVIHLL